MSVLALMGLLGILFALWAGVGGNHYNEAVIYVFGLIGLFITGGIFASTSFTMLNAKDTGIYWISFPASHLEKFLVALFFNVIMFSATYFLCFELLKFLAEQYVEGLVKAYPLKYSYLKLDWLEKDGPRQAIPVFVCAFFSMQAAFLLGSIWFKRFSFIITTVIIAIAIFFTIFYLIKLSQGMLPDGYRYGVTNVTTDDGNGIYKLYEMNAGLKKSIEIFFKYLLTPFLWLITWYKLKEKEI